MAPETAARLKLKEIIDAEFAAEGLVTEHDRLHPSLGSDRPRVGVYPSEARATDDMNVLVSEIVVQFYGKWEKQVNNEQHVDPSIIEAMADRFRQACRRATNANLPESWFFNVMTVIYPPDPTGNITRFEAIVQAWGNNPALVETV